MTLVASGTRNRFTPGCQPERPLPSVPYASRRALSLRQEERSADWS